MLVEIYSQAMYERQKVGRAISTRKWLDKIDCESRRALMAQYARTYYAKPESKLKIAISYKRKNDYKKAINCLYRSYDCMSA